MCSLFFYYLVPFCCNCSPLFVILDFIFILVVGAAMTNTFTAEMILTETCKVHVWQHGLPEFELK